MQVPISAVNGYNAQAPTVNIASMLNKGIDIAITNKGNINPQWNYEINLTASWLHNEIKACKPHVIISVHAPHSVLDFDGPPTGVKPPSRFGRLQLHRLGVYPGSLGNFGGLKEGIPVVTLELPHALDMPTAQELAQVWRDMQDWLKRNLVDGQPGPS